MTLSGTRESAQPIHSTGGDWPLALSVKNECWAAVNDEAQAALDASRLETAMVGGESLCATGSFVLGQSVTIPRQPDNAVWGYPSTDPLVQDRDLRALAVT